ncbi:TlpA family protein disulfide reductase [Motilimonas eburnea]|uniref:TlpA family protein disulfide reductase n=1 Tax=Motilimonas eburnea TaxID=1737488 RepID=UPI001E3BF3EE|nr:TlpA disulfide reductase family protein [Motilimonas eburnea]MCE2573727.1 TlpA family protein disulfide reductase [Motilimonas eburnea]
MKLHIGVLSLLFLLTGCGQAELTLSSGKNANLSDYQGQWLWVNYYADWCKPCIKELPELDQFDRASDQHTVIAISYDDLALAELQASWQKRQVSFDFARVEREDFRLARPKVLPTTYLLNPQGELVATLIGEQNRASLAQAWQQALSD